MLVSCTSCSAKFNIPDAKVAGKRARMKCKKCGTPIAIDGTQLGSPDVAEQSAPKEKRTSTAPKRPVTSSGISTRWRASEPSGKNHEMALGKIAELYSSGKFEPGTLVCAPGSQDWLPPYDHPEVMEKASPPGEAPAPRDPQPTFSEDTVTLNAEESAKLTREAQGSQGEVPKNTFFGGEDVDDAMDAFDNIMSVAPPKKETGAAVALKNVPATRPSSPPSSVPPPAKTPSRPPSSERATRASSRPSARPSSRPVPSSSSPPPPSTRPSRPPAPKPPSPSQRPSAAPASNPFAPRSSAPPAPSAPPPAPSVPPPFPGSAPPAMPASSPPAPAPATPTSQAPAAPPSQAPAALAPGPTQPPPSQPSPSMRPSEPTFGNLSQPPKVRRKKSNGLLPIFLVLVLLLGAIGGIYLFRPAMFERGMNRIKGMLGQETSTEVAPKAKGPPFDAQAAGAVLGQVAEHAAKCSEPGGPTGRGRAEVLFVPAGGATSAAVSKPFHETNVGRCLIEMFKGAKVPAFGGDPVKVTKTFEVQ